MKDLREKLLSEDFVYEIPGFFDDLSFLKSININEFIRDHESRYTGRILEFTAEQKNLILEQLKRKVPFTLSNNHLGRFRLTSSHDNGTDRAKIHIDLDSLVLIVYLTDSKDKGTTFYRHKKLHITRYSANLPQKAQLIQDMLLEHDSGNQEKWDVWKSIDTKSNLAILFDGHLFHGGPQSFSGVNKVDSRITVDFFFERSEL